MVLCLPDFWSNWNLEMLGFEKRGKPEYPEKNLLEQKREPTTNSTHIIMASMPGFEPRPRWWGGDCSHHCAIPCSPYFEAEIFNS